MTVHPASMGIEAPWPPSCRWANYALAQIFSCLVTSEIDTQLKPIKIYTLSSPIEIKDEYSGDKIFLKKMYALW